MKTAQEVLDAIKKALLDIESKAQDYINTSKKNSQHSNSGSPYDVWSEHYHFSLESFQRGKQVATYELQSLIVSLQEEIIKSEQKEFIKVPILETYAGGYRIEYDGKYLSLYGFDMGFRVPKILEGFKEDYEEVLLVPVVLARRNLSPEIVEVNDKEITIKLI